MTPLPAAMRFSCMISRSSRISSRLMDANSGTRSCCDVFRMMVMGLLTSQTAKRRRARDPSDTHDEGGGSQIDSALGRHAVNHRPTFAHDSRQLRIDALLFPNELLNILHPLEVGHGHAAAVGVDVGHHGDATLEI